MDAYPKWIYSREGARIIQGASEYPASGWFESPALVPLDEPAPEPVPEALPEAAPEATEAPESAQTVESVRAQLDALGIDYDKRWGLARLTALLPD